MIQAVYIIWLREMKRFIRSKSRIIGSLLMPVFFLAFLGFGFNQARLPGIPEWLSYIDYLTPGIIGMTILFTSVFSGVSLIWDREFGFLKEIMVSPVRRVWLVLGRIVGGMTTTLIQAVMIAFLSILVGFTFPPLAGFLLSLGFMVLLSISFIGLGLVFASKFMDIHGFGLIMNLVMFPVFFLSGALYPIENLPAPLQAFAYLNPFSYGVDGLRGCMTGWFSFNPLQDLVVILIFSIFTVFLGAYLFEKTES